jgi:flagellar assembly factor FliW
MQIESTRFGTLEVGDDRVIRFPRGLLAFPDEHEFVLVQHRGSSAIAWLQSSKTPGLALPVVSAQALANGYPDVPLADAARRAGLEGQEDDLAALVVLSAAEGTPATVNLAAPILVDASRWTGVQAILEGTHFSTREMFAMSDEISAPATAE